jgi:hypothetical protein
VSRKNMQLAELFIDITERKGITAALRA